MSQTQIDTYFTNRIGTTQLLYSAEDWVQISLRLETAGPVSVSTRQQIVPVLSGKGRLLPFDEDVKFFLPRGDRLYIAADSVNRVSVMIEPVPWAKAILMALDRGFGAVVRSIFGLGGGGGGGGGAPHPDESPVPCPPEIKPWKA